MDPKCIAAVRAAAGGRSISDAKLATIEAAIVGKMKELARSDRQRWLSLTPDQRMTEAATAATKDVYAQAQLKEYRETLQVLRTGETDTRIQKAMELSELTRSQGFIRDIEQTGQYIDGVRNESIASLGDMIDAAQSKDGTGLLRNLSMRIFDVDNPAMTADVVREVFASGAGSTGNKVAQAGAKAWLSTIEAMRLRFNAAGGDVGKLGYGYLAQAHDAAKVRDAGTDKWSAQVLPLLDREQYVRPDGRLLDDAEMLDLLRAAHDTLATGGLNKVEPGQFTGTGARANRGSDSRVLHFKDGDAWMNYMREFGEGSLYDAMVGHVGRMARDIGLVERYGPNPEQQFRVQVDVGKRADDLGGWAGVTDQRLAGTTAEAYWNVVSGKAATPENVLLSQVGQDLRNIQTAAKLGGAVLTSTTDMGTIAATLHYNKLPYFDMLRNIGKQFDGDTRDFLQAHGIIGESLTSTLNRWTGDNMTHSLTGRVAGSVMKLSLMNAWTDGLRNAFSMTLMGGLGKMSAKKWGDLTEWDRHLLERKGMTEADWNVVNQAQLTDHQGKQYLTPQSIKGITDADMQVVAPDTFAAISQRIKEQTATLSERNVQEAGWITGRIDKFDAARNGLNKAVKTLLDKKLKANEKATEPLLQRMNLLDFQREQAKLHSDIETQLNKFFTEDEIRTFLNAVEDGASADKTDLGGAKPALRVGLRQAEKAGREFGEVKGRIERQMHEAENRIAAMDREAISAANKAGKEAQAKADAMSVELQDFITRSKERQQARLQVIDRLQRDEAPAFKAEADRLRAQVATKILAFTLDEAQFAVVNPDVATRAIVTGGGRPAGTIDGELWRSFAQFKSFPIAMLTRHWRRVLDTPQGLEGAPLGFGAESASGAVFNKVAVLAALNLTLTMIGGMVLQNKALVQGKDPYDMTEGKFWMRAFTQGGGAGYLGDLVFKDPTEQRGNKTEQVVGTVLGPSAGAVAGLAGDLVVANAWEAAKGKDTHIGAEALRWTNSQLPYANLWWSRAAYEHWFLFSAQEALNPGYLSRMKQRAQKDWHQGYWWDPADAVPDRAPEFENAIGR